MKSIIDPNSGVTAFYYDTAGRKIAEVAPKDYVQGKDLSAMNRIEYIYDLMGRIKIITSTYFDAISKTWNSIVTKAYSYTNTASGTLVKEIDALGLKAGTGTTIDDKRILRFRWSFNSI